MAASFSLAGAIRLTPTWTEPLDLVDVVDRTVVAETLALANGTGSDQGNFYWKDVRTIAANSLNTIQLASLPLTTYGGTATLAVSQLRLIYVKNRSTSVQMQYRIRGTQPEFTLQPGGMFVWYSPSNAQHPPLAVISPATIQLRNPTNFSGDYEIVLAGVKS